MIWFTTTLNGGNIDLYFTEGSYVCIFYLAGEVTWDYIGQFSADVMSEWLETSFEKSYIFLFR